MDNICTLIENAQRGSEDALETIIRENSKLIWSVVKHFTNRAAEPEDLYQIGSIGLIKAVRRFDFSRNVKFSTYAVPMISGEIRKFLRDDGIIKVSRTTKEMSYKIWKMTNEAAEKCAREPTISEIAEKLGISAEEAAAAAAACAAPISINNDEGDNSPIIDTLASADNLYDNVIDRIDIDAAAKNLPPKERLILTMRYYQNKTQAQTARRLGMSQAQVSRLEKKMLETLKCVLV